MKKIEATFTSLFNVGVKDSYPLSERTRIQNLNKICTFTALLVLFIMFFVPGNIPVLIGLMAYFVVFISVYIFHYFEKYLWYNFFISIATGLINIYLGGCFEQSLGIEIYFIVTFVAILYHFSEHKMRKFNVFFTAICFLITMTMRFFHIHYFPAPSISPYVFYINSLTALSLLYFIVVKYRTVLLKSQEEIHQKNILLQKQKEELQHSSEIKDKLFSIIGHDLRAPLTSINGFLTLLEMGYLDENQKIIYTQKLRKSITGASQTLDNLVLWYIQEQKNETIKKENILLYEVVETVFSTLNILAEEKAIRLSHRVPTDLVVNASPNFLPFIIRNLVANALKFTSKGGEISAYIHQYNEKEICVAIKDTGVGIKPENMDKLFSFGLRYTTLGTEKEKGTGLGLPLCKEFAEKNGSRLWAESEVGKGSIFYFTLSY